VYTVFILYWQVIFLATKEERLGTQKMGTLMLQMGLPTMAAQLVNLLYNIIDRVYIGHLPGIGTNALTGVGVTMPIIMIISALAAFVGSGGAPQAAIALGKGDREKAERILGNGVVTLLVISVFSMVLFYLVRKPFIFFIGASEETWPYADDYICHYLIGTVFVQLTLGLNAFITSQGRSTSTMLCVVVGAVLNIILDPVFMFALDMGVKGAAIATVISQAASAAMTLTTLTSEKSTLRIRLSRMKPDFKIIRQTASLGVSPFIMMATESLISIIMSSNLAKYGGDLYVGSLTILQSCMQFLTIPVNGFSSGIIPIMSYNFGARNNDRVRQAYRRLFLATFTYVFLIVTLIQIRPSMFARIFTDNPDMVALIGRVLPIFVVGMYVFPIQMTSQMAFISTNRPVTSLLIAVLRKIVLLIPLALILPRFLGVNGIYIAEPIADATAAIVCGILFLCMIRGILEKGPKN